jgi:hypothetical protein
VVKSASDKFLRTLIRMPGADAAWCEQLNFAIQRAINMKIRNPDGLLNVEDFFPVEASRCYFTSAFSYFT